ncbi:MAG: single-stranded-DNA-specific exonuclease [Candidatus Paceibacteria bacterium]|jgi:single-stranded-DNA-specific exonuclease
MAHVTIHPMKTKQTEIPDKVQEELNSYSSLVQRLLFNRGIETGADAEVFLNPDFEKRHDPFLIKDMEKAVVRLFKAVEKGERVVIYGDYDCDGIPASVVMHDLLRKIGYENFEVYIPHRHNEGYGLNTGAIDKLVEAGAKLLITVDLGITNVDEVAHAEAAGLDIIITDHHEIPDNIPKAYAVINPKTGGYPDPMLCGAGVAFKFVEAFLQKYGESFDVKPGWEKWLLDMVGLATLSDMVPLVNENRIFAYYGLMVMRKNKRLGMQKLFSKLRLNPTNLVEEDLTFSVAPRINAASRMAEPIRAFELLSATEEGVAGERAKLLTNLNDERKKLVAQYMKKAKSVLKERPSRNVIVIGDTKWQVGILGLVAGKLADEHKCPVFVWGGNGGEVLKGSCRSDGSVNLVELMKGLPDGSLLGYGGHEMAGGFSISKKQIHVFEGRAIEVYESLKKDSSEIPVTEVDANLDLKDINKDTVKDLKRLAPYGVGNPKPTFMFENVEVMSARDFGKEKNHLEIVFTDGKVNKKAIAFFKTTEDYKIESGQKRSFIGAIEESFFAGRYEIRLKVIDIM